MNLDEVIAKLLELREKAGSSDILPTLVEVGYAIYLISDIELDNKGQIIFTVVD